MKYLPNGFNYGRLLDLKAVKEVAKDDINLYNLLTITISGNIADTEKTESILEQTIQKYGYFNNLLLLYNLLDLNREELFQRIRLNSVFQLARTSKSLKLKDVADKLRVYISNYTCINIELVIC